MVTLIVVTLAGWSNRRQQDVIEYLPEEVGRRNIEPEIGARVEGQVNFRERLGGLLRYYHRDAA